MIQNPIRPSPLPKEFRQKVPSGSTYFKLTETLRRENLHTVCEEAKCPNRTECYAAGTLTFQILGELCTRRCGFCAEKTARPNPVDESEPERVLRAAKDLGLSHIVLTAPARDDLRDGGAGVFARTVRLLKENLRATVEVLVSDLEGNEAALQTVLDSGPDVFNHNIETVRSLTPKVRSKATYDRSLEVLENASRRGASGMKTKSGLMVGLGETWDEIRQTFSDLSESGVKYVTVGQYLQPSEQHLSIQKFYTISEFAEVKKIASEFGFEKAFAGPLVRSSYHAGEMIQSV